MRGTTVEKLARVAAIYDGAARDGRKPTEAVAAVLGVTRTAAAQLVRRARLAGQLPATTRGQATAPEHAAVTAVISRGGGQEQRWLTCRTCLVPWPCTAWRGGR